jgi:uncharacterized protein (DUF1684 family)
LDQAETATWKRALLRLRTEKDEYFAQDLDSPLTPEDRATFRGFRYFDPDPAFRFESKLSRYENPETVAMATSKGARQLFKRVGYFDFTVGGQQVRVHAYQSAERDDPHLFIPFRDATSGKESYGAARYIDLEVQHNDEYAVDFNSAYNPYCAYNDGYVCPLPPKENWLTVPIFAGEKNFRG